MVSHSKSGARHVKISWRGVLELSWVWNFWTVSKIPGTYNFCSTYGKLWPGNSYFHLNQVPSTGIWCSHGSDWHWNQWWPSVKNPGFLYKNFHNLLLVRTKLDSGGYVKFWPRMSVKLKLVWQKPGRNLSAALRPGERRINFAEFIRRSRRINLSAKFLRY